MEDEAAAVEGGEAYTAPVRDRGSNVFTISSAEFQGRSGMAPKQYPFLKSERLKREAAERKAEKNVS